MPGIMGRFGVENFGAQGPISTPIQSQAPQSFISPMIIEKIKALVNPASNYQPGSMSTPMESYNPNFMGFTNEPDYTGQFGFPEKPIGIGGLRPLGGIKPQDINLDLSAYTDEGNKNWDNIVSKEGIYGDPGGVSLFGEHNPNAMKDMRTLNDLLWSVFKNFNQGSN